MRNKRVWEVVYRLVLLWERAMAIQACLYFNFAVVFSSSHFRFRQVHTKAISMPIGKAQQTGSVYL
jgi:hypothetical protein